MRLLKAKTLTFKKFEEGFYDEDGLYVDGFEHEFDVEGSLQPFRLGTKRDVLPEGVSSTDARVFFTRSPIFTTNHLENTQAYETTIDGYVYVTVESDPWIETTLSIDHYEVVLVRKDKNENDDQ